MKTQNGFTRFDNIKEFENWLNKQKVNRKITRLQVHHMDLPNYYTWTTTDKKVYGNNRELGRTKSLDDYGKKTWRSGDGYGHYIAQHFNIFPNGKITTGRNLNSKPIGIRGWNDNAICIEIYGDFDTDIMTSEQKATVIAVYALLCKRFHLSPNITHIRPHGFFTAGGTYLGKYNASRSAKTCPGLKFFGGLNKFEDNFLPEIKKYMNGQKPNTTMDKVTEPLKSNDHYFLVKVLTDNLNIRKEASFSSKIVDQVNKGDVYTIVEEKNGLGKLKSGIGWISMGSKYVKKV